MGQRLEENVAEGKQWRSPRSKLFWKRHILKFKTCSAQNWNTVSHPGTTQSHPAELLRSGMFRVGQPHTGAPAKECERQATWGENLPDETHFLWTKRIAGVVRWNWKSFARYHVQPLHWKERKSYFSPSCPSSASHCPSCLDQRRNSGGGGISMGRERNFELQLLHSPHFIYYILKILSQAWMVGAILQNGNSDKFFLLF